MNPPSARSTQPGLPSGTSSVASASTNVLQAPSQPSRPPTPGPQIQSRIRPGPEAGASSTSQATRSAVLLNPQGRRYWVPARRDWDNDATTDSPCSYELLLQWMEIPGNWALFKGGARGSSQTKGAQLCEEWLKSHFCPTQRKYLACQAKVDDWLSGTGNGDGGKAIQDASDADRERIIQDVMGELDGHMEDY
ncbi:hypothetical protein BCR39DRAFT_508313 [Naematelia encephala]|uniref:Uncharacterized protein n=1 Tax=Naematelia encephala TaxID=71784 RepID=A0A1Y2AHM1_9TREE|nr:hypothetical protein BCR39DRAFT_508313 [Naematelia encephala]